MATGSSASLPFLPPELWRMIVLNFQSVDDFEDLHYVSTQLRSVSRLFKVTVEAFRPLASLFSSAEVKIPESSWSPCSCVSSEFWELEFELEGTFDRFSVDGQTAIFRVDRPDWSEKECLEDYGTSYAPHVIEQYHPFENVRAKFIDFIMGHGNVEIDFGHKKLVQFCGEKDPDVEIYYGQDLLRVRKVKCDLVTQEILIPVREVYSGISAMVKERRRKSSKSKESN